VLSFSAALVDLPGLLAGIPLTFWIALCSFALGSLAAVPLAALRLSPVRVATPVAVAWIELFRTTPPLVHIIWAYYVLPSLGITLSALTAVIAALGAGMSAQMAEIFRGALQAVPRAQDDSAIVLGLNPVHRYCDVILPQALRFIMAPACNSFAGVMKDSSLAAVIAVPELMNRAQIASVEDFRPLEVLTFVAVVYFVLIYPFIIAAGILERRSRVGYRVR
jgi:His/Glu/Gln/Arg/opine family amino acid ABC transporter permease subunit